MLRGFVVGVQPLGCCRHAKAWTPTTQVEHQAALWSYERDLLASVALVCTLILDVDLPRDQLAFLNHWLFHKRRGGGDVAAVGSRIVVNVEPFFLEFCVATIALERIL